MPQQNGMLIHKWTENFNDVKSAWYKVHASLISSAVVDLKIQEGGPAYFEKRRPDQTDLQLCRLKEKCRQMFFAIQVRF